MTDKVRGALGLSMRAGKCLSGDFAVEEAVKKGKVLLLVLDEEVSEATRERYGNKGVPVLFVKDPGEAIGKPERKILGITEEGFVTLIRKAANETKLD